MNLPRLVAIMGLTLRDAVRSRVVVCLLAALLLLLVGLPLLVQSDGTPVGRLRIILEYALASAVGLVSAATLWAGCATMAAELQDRRLFVVLAKPVRRWEIWLGKWLGIVVLDAAVLAVTGLVVAVLVAAIRPAGGADAQFEALLAGRESFRPDWAAAGLAAPNAKASSDAAHGAARSVALQSGHALDLTFPAGATAPVGPMELRVRLGSSRPNRAPVQSDWEFGPPGKPSCIVSSTNAPGLPMALTVPVVAWGPEGVHVRLINRTERDPATLVLTTGADGVELLVPRDGFAINLTRGLLVIFARLAFLAALGVTAGCLLSLPVAVFVSVFVLVLIASAGYVETVAVTGMYFIPMESEAPELGWLDHVVLAAFKVMNVATQPLTRLNPVPLLADGRQVAWAIVTQAALLFGFLYSGVAALFGIWRFARREVGRAGTE